jgi:hypothetical protein
MFFRFLRCEAALGLLRRQCHRPPQRQEQKATSAAQWSGKAGGLRILGWISVDLSGTDSS